MSALVAIEGLSKRFRGLWALRDVTFSVPEGGIVALIGPNGAGKTTCFNIIAGAFQPDGGRILFAGRPLAGLVPEQICAAGIARTFQIVKPFHGMSVLENVMVGAFHRTTRVHDARLRALALLARLGLEAKANMAASQLTLPDRKLLEVARALATGPRLLLLDEVMAGLRPSEGARIVAVLKELKRAGLTILLIEHVMRVVMAVAERVVVLHHGEKIADDLPENVVRDPAVIASYLGHKEAR